ncbi:MAG: hypothetical protein A3I06_07810 [Candidatus Lindowbacteria bacterium RIFCSPLOWO2_02_FULL_62_12]|nr:MAG: hypothetical protein A3I06_07810 [Candidatus Lindowbacteria bacterium RIFCSPLOWO2_02_FULL_62_12]
MILEQLLKLLTDSSSDPEGQLRILARHTQESLDASFVELRMDGMPVIRLGDGAADARRYPISSGNRTVGELTLAPVPEDDPDQLAAIVRCAEVIYRLRAGYVDTLTGLYNRRRLDMEMEALALSDEPVTIAMLDIDHFKHVNDTHGHPAGDAVLKQFSARLAACLPAGGFLARYGGEEFCVILREVDEPAWRPSSGCAMRFPWSRCARKNARFKSPPAPASPSGPPGRHANSWAWPTRRSTRRRPAAAISRSGPRTCRGAARRSFFGNDSAASSTGPSLILRGSASG